MRRFKNPPVAFRVKSPLIAVTKDRITDAVIPEGSMIEWQPGDFAGGVATIFWLKRPVVVMESDLFKQCERMASGIAKII
jgi:hypothetical protein